MVPHVPETLHRCRGTLRIYAAPLHCLYGNMHHSPGSTDISALTAPQGQWLSGYHTGNRLVLELGIGIHDPGHYLRSRVHIRSGPIPALPHPHSPFTRVA